MKNKMKIQTLAEVAILAALGYILDFLAGIYSGFLPFANGGSISIALIAVIIISLRRGFVPSFLCGMIIGLLDLMDGFYAIADKWYFVFAQISFDYLLPYALCSLATLFKPLIKKTDNKICRLSFIGVASISAGLCKYLSHFISGVFFWPETPDANAIQRITYSLAYNGGYMIPSIILTTILIIAIGAIQPKLLNLKSLSKTA